ncbi:MAG TPA: hypothetical protein VFR37_05025 [Longimicrobium sp.]|nr:hypothetical protein [Longimicrobium sp.]
MAVVEVGLDLSALRRQSRTTLRRAAVEAGADAGGVLTRAFGGSVSRGVPDAAAGAIRRGRTRTRQAAQEAGREAGEAMGTAMGQGVDRAANRGPLSGDRVAARYMRMMERGFRAREAEIHAAQVALLMTPAEAAAAGRAAAKAHNEAMLRSIQRLGTARARGAGRTAAGTDAITAMRETLILPRQNPARARRDGEAVAQRYIAGLRARLDADGARIKAELLSKLISPREAERQGKEAAERYQRALLRTMRRMQAEGRLTRGAATAFGDAMINTQEWGKALRDVQAPSLLSRIGQAARTWIAGVFVASVLAAIGVLWKLNSTLNDARERIMANLRLIAASKLYDVPLKQLRELAATAQESFQITGTQANELATQVGKMAGRAQQAARAQDLLNAAMDLGAANGLTLQEIILAVDQAFRQQDEGLNRLGLADPSQHYKKLAREIGVAEDKLTDAQKQMALMNAIIEAGTRVQGEWGRQLQGDIGTLNQWENAVREGRQEIGVRWLPIAAQMTQRLRGPLAGAIRFVTGLLDGMTSALDRVIRKMHEMNVAQARIAPYEAQRNIREGREAMERLVPEMDRLARRVGIDPGTQRNFWEGEWLRPRVTGGEFRPDEIAAAQRRAAQTQRFWERVARGGRASLSDMQANAPVNPGNERGTAALIQRAALGDRGAAQRLLSDAQDYRMAADELQASVGLYVQMMGRVGALEEQMPTLVEKAGLQEQLDDVNAASERLMQTARQAAQAQGITGEAWARLTEQQRTGYLNEQQRGQLDQLRQRAAALDLQINGPQTPPPTPTTPTETEKVKASVEGAREALRELTAELGTLASFRDAAGEPFRTLDEVPAELRGAIQGVIALESEIAALEERVRESGQPASAAVQRHLAGLRALAAERKADTLRMRDEMAGRGDLISEEARRVRDGAREAVTGFQALQSFGVGTQAPEALVSMVEEVTRFDEQLKKARADLEILRRENVAPPEGVEAWVAHLEAQRAETVRLIGTFSQLREVLDDLPTLSAEFFRGMDAGELEQTRQQLLTLAEQTARVREAEEALFLARQQHGNGSREVREAERELAEVRRESRRVLLVLIRAVQASTLSLQEKRRVVALPRRELEGLGGDAEDSARGLRKIADAINLASQTATSLAEIGVELELINEKQSDVITGFAQMADNAARFAVAMKTGDVAGMIGSAVGFIQGGIRFYQGLTGESEAQKAVRSAMLDLRDALESLEKTIISDRSTEDVSEDREQLRRAREALFDDPQARSSYGPTRRGSLADLAVELGLADARDSKGAQIEALRRWAQEMDEAYGTNLAWFVENSRPQELLAAIAQLETQLGRELTEMGTFGTDVAGVLERINFELDILGETDVAKRIRRQTEGLLASSNNLGEFVDELRELASLDLSTEAGRARRDAIVREMLARSQATGVDFGSMTPEQFRELLTAWAQATPGGEMESGSQAVNRSVTEVTGNRLVGWLATIAHYVRRLFEYVSGTSTDGLAAAAMAPAPPSVALSPAGPPVTSPTASGSALLGTLAALNGDAPAARMAPGVVAALVAALPRGEGGHGDLRGAFVYIAEVPVSIAGSVSAAEAEGVGRGIARGIQRGLGYEADEALGARMLRQLRAAGRGHEFNRGARK